MPDYGKTNDYWPSNYWSKIYFYWPTGTTAEIIGVILTTLGIGGILLTSALVNRIEFATERINDVEAIINQAWHVNTQVTPINALKLAIEVRT